MTVHTGQSLKCIHKASNAHFDAVLPRKLGARILSIIKQHVCRFLTTCRDIYWKESGRTCQSSSRAENRSPSTRPISTESLIDVPSVHVATASSSTLPCSSLRHTHSRCAWKVLSRSLCVSLLSACVAPCLCLP